MVPGRIDDRVGGKRRIDLRIARGVGSYKPLRHHPDHRERHIGDDQLAPNHIGRAVEPRLPELLRDDHRKTRRISTLAVIFRGQITSHQWRSLQCPEELPAHQHSVNVLVARPALYLQNIRVVGEDIRKDLVRWSPGCGRTACKMSS